MLSYGALFLSALMAASFLPMQSEAVLVGLLVAETGTCCLSAQLSPHWAMFWGRWSTGFWDGHFGGLKGALGFRLHKRKCSARSDGTCATGAGLCWEAGCRLSAIRLQWLRARFGRGFGRLWRW